MKMNECLRAAQQGAVLVSPAISKGEKAIMRAVFKEGLPLVYLQENGFTDLAKPGGMRMDACARGQLLILAPWEHHNEKIAIKRGAMPGAERDGEGNLRGLSAIIQIISE